MNLPQTINKSQSPAKLFQLQNLSREKPRS